MSHVYDPRWFDKKPWPWYIRLLLKFKKSHYGVDPGATRWVAVRGKWLFGTFYVFEIMEG